ncbi:MAG: hypothetical protein AB8B46_00905 [Candidatus Midichloriaceae bacterium]
MNHYYTASCFTATMITHHTGRLLKKLTPAKATYISSLVNEMGYMIRGEDQYVAPVEFVEKYGYQVAQIIHSRMIDYDFKDNDVIDISDTSALSFKMAENLLNLDKYIPVMHSAAFGVDIWQYLQIHYYMKILDNYSRNLVHFLETGEDRLAEIAKEELEDKVYESFDELTYDQQLNNMKSVINIYMMNMIMMRRLNH